MRHTYTHYCHLTISVIGSISVTDSRFVDMLAIGGDDEAYMRDHECVGCCPDRCHTDTGRIHLAVPRHCCEEEAIF